MKQAAVYIITNKINGTLYIRVTSNLKKRIYEHKNGMFEGFTKKYNCTILVWYDLFETMVGAISHEKQIKSWPRKRKLFFIELKNPTWKDLYDSF